MIMLAHHVTATVISGIISSVIGRAINGGSRVVSGVISRVIRRGGAHAGVINHLIRGVISEQLVVPWIKSRELWMHHMIAGSREQALEAEVIDGKVREIVDEGAEQGVKGGIKD